MKNYLLYLALIILTFSSCKKEDFNLNADYKDTPSVFGLLDKSQTRQYIRINRTFQGTGSAFDYALVKDSSEYKDSDLSGRIVELVNGNETKSWPLLSTQLARDSNTNGDFYLDSVKVYYFDNNLWNIDATYRLEFTAKGVSYTAETVLVENDYNLKKPSVIGASNVLPTMRSQTSFNDLVIELNESMKNAARYEYYWTLKYDEYVGNSLTPKIIRFKAGENTNALGNIPFVGVSYERFLTHIANTINNENISGVTKRVFKGVNAEIIAGSSELDVYMSLTDPNLASLNDRPSYGNISNGGIGLFSSRVYLKSLDNSKTSDRDYYFDIQSNGVVSGVSEFLRGSITGNLNFCLDSLHIEQKLSLNQNKQLYLNETCN